MGEWTDLNGYQPSGLSNERSSGSTRAIGFTVNFELGVPGFHTWTLESQGRRRLEQDSWQSVVVLS